MIHVIRNSMDFASWKNRKPIAAELEADAPGQRTRTSHAGAGEFRRPRLSQRVCSNHAKLAGQLAASPRPFLAFPVAVRRTDLHHERHGIVEHRTIAAAQCGSERRFSICGCRPRCDFPWGFRLAPGHAGMENPAARWCEAKIADSPSSSTTGSSKHLIAPRPAPHTRFLTVPGGR